MNSHYPHLFSPIKIGNVTIPNRLVLASIDSVLRTDEGGTNDRHLTYLAARAKGGVGLIMTDALAVEWPRGAVGAKGARLDQDRFIPGFNDLVEEVHYHGSKIMAQLIHAGRQATLSATQGMPLISASDVPFEGSGAVPLTMSLDDIEQMVNLFADAADRAKRAGFDGIEVHACHGYLLSSFLSPFTNTRTDWYGGNTYNRTRIVREVIQKVRERVGDDYPVMCRINGSDYVEDGGLTNEEAKRVAVILEEVGVDAIHVSAGTYESDAWTYPPMMKPDCVNVPLAAEIKKVVNIPVITVGKIMTPEQAESIVADGSADLVAMARALLAEPEFAKKAKAGKPETIRPCIACNYGCIARIELDKHVCCSVNPAVGKEEKYAVKKADKPKNILVIGGGPAGMEVARIASTRGHKVTLVEKESELGGQLRLASAPDFKADIKKYLAWLGRELKRLDVNVIMNTKADESFIKNHASDEVVIACGANPRETESLRLNDAQPNVIMYDAALDPEAALTDSSYAVIGAGSTGCETAMVLAKKGKNVHLIEQQSQILADQDFSIQEFYAEGFREYNVNLLLDTRVLKVTDKGVEVVHKNRVKEIHVDKIVLALGHVAEKTLSDDLNSLENVHCVGDCVVPQNLMFAVDGAFRVATKL